MTFDTIFANSPSNVNSQNELLTWCSHIPSKAVMILYEDSKTKVKVESQFSGFYVTVGVHQESILPPLLFAIVVDVVTENARKRLNERGFLCR